MKIIKTNLIACFLLLVSLMVSCTDDSDPVVGQDIDSASKVGVDRFSASAGHLMVRTSSNGLPGANTPVNFDQPPFITTGFDRAGAVTTYYNFDIQSTTPDEIYVFFEEGNTTPVNGQNNIINTIPGDAGYNDFWVVNMVIVEWAGACCLRIAAMIVRNACWFCFRFYRCSCGFVSRHCCG